MLSNLDFEDAFRMTTRPDLIRNSCMKMMMASGVFSDATDC
jgi:hypothetical protein